MSDSINSLIIPAYWATPELFDMTQRCLDSVKDEDLQIILAAANQPYTVNTNAGLKAAIGDILIVGNNDLIFHKGWLEALLGVLEGYDIATCWSSDQDVILEDRIEEDAKFGSLFAMKRKVYEQLGGFDEQFKGYFADDDYRRRAIEAGFKIGKKLNLVVEHKAKATYKITDPSDNEFLRASRLYEAKWGAKQ